MIELEASFERKAERRAKMPRWSNSKAGLLQTLRLQKLSGLVVALTAASLWLGGETSARADATRARQTFNLCTSCHGQKGQGNAEIKAPPIAGLPGWYIKNQLEKFRAGHRGAHPKDVVGLHMRPMARMLTDEDIALMSGYVSALPVVAQPVTVTGSLVKGEATFQTCQACHGPKGLGNQQLNAPPIAISADWYLLDQLAKFKAGIRGGDPKTDPIGAGMQGISTALDEAAMKNVVAYINTLKP